jgi:hypothetical protein
MTSRQAQMTIEHQDNFRSDLGKESSYSVDVTITMNDDDDEMPEASDGGDNDTASDDPIDAGTVTLTHPVADTQDLKDRAYLNAQLAAHNHTASEQDSLAPEAFNAKLLHVADRALASVGVNVTDAPVKPLYVYAYLLHEAWGWDSTKTLHEELEGQPQTLARTGTDELCSLTTLYRRVNEMEEAGLTELISRAADHAVHAVWREYPLPDEVAANWELDLDMGVSESSVTRPICREAVRNWARILMTDAAKHLTFNRIGKIEYDIEQIIAAFAHSALQSIGLTNGHRTAAYLYDEDSIPSGTTVTELFRAESEYANSLDKQTIEDQFEAVHCSVLDRFKANGLFGDGTVDLAGDTTDEPWWGGVNPHTIGTAFPRNDSTPVWEYAMVGTVKTDAPVCFGVSLVESKDQHPAAFNKLLDRAARYTDINYAFFDKEFYDGGVIETIHNHDCNGLIVKASNTEKIKDDVIAPTPEGESDEIEGVDVTSATPNPNVFVVPKGADTESNTRRGVARQQTLTQYNEDTNGRDDTDSSAGNVSSHIVYVSYLSVEEHDAEDINDEYGNRWAVETLIRAIKRVFLPKSGSSNERLRIYIANIAVVFYNWLSLVNNALSPQFKLPLNITGKELLTAVRDVGFREDLEVTDP